MASNRLAVETSPYLLQHADNPVAWYPWGAEALEKARREDKPILLSIGYSACHWCHVMAHESFEDADTARLMNEQFVNIKVDREERPDLDKIYQVAHQMLTQRPGGWPLTMFLTPDDHMPFFGGTYFPREPRYGIASFGEVLQAVAAFYRNERDEIHRQNEAVRRVFANIQDQGARNQDLGRAALDAARSELGETFDEVHGGFGGAPKFPQPTALERLLEYSVESRGPDGEADERALNMVATTLRKMALGGLQDQLGGGFYRYSVDDRWMIPHFEKMLYDNAPLLHLYAATWKAAGDPLFRSVAEGIAAWVMREMQAEDGGYYATLDADSEGHEGAYYVWTREQLSAALNDTEFRVAEGRFGLDGKANFEGRWHLHVAMEDPELARRVGVPEDEIGRPLEQVRTKLLAVRAARVPPHRDDKIITGWNGLMIRGMASAGRRLGRGDLTASAERALAFVRGQLWRDGRLLATYREGRAAHAAYLDDYAFLLDGVLELLQTRWRTADLDLARTLADTLLARFEDATNGGFFFTADDHERLIHRPKPYGDDATPAGNGIAALALQRLGHLLGEPRYLDAAARTLKAAAAAVHQAPAWHNALLRALAEHLQPPQIVIVRGPIEQAEQWREAIQAAYAPHRLCFTIGSDVPDLPDTLAAYTAKGEGPAAYVCSGTQCSPPLESLQALQQHLALSNH